MRHGRGLFIIMDRPLCEAVLCRPSQANGKQQRPVELIGLCKCHHTHTHYVPLSEIRFGSISPSQFSAQPAMEGQFLVQLQEDTEYDNNEMAAVGV